MAHSLEKQGKLEAATLVAEAVHYFDHCNDKLDEARNYVDQAQQAMSRFRTELADVSQLRVPDLQVGEFTSFADYFFDGLFVDWMVLDRIQQSTDQVEETYARIKGVLDWLNKSLEQATARTNELRTKADAVVVDSEPPLLN